MIKNTELYCELRRNTIISDRNRMWKFLRVVASTLRNGRVFQMDYSTPPSSSSSSSSSLSDPPSTAPSSLFDANTTVAKPIKFLEGYDSIEELKSASESVKKIFDLEFACRREVNKAKMAEVIDKYKLEEDDTSSIEVQVATLTLRVKLLTEHLKAHRKDFSCKRRLLQLVQRRRKLLLRLKEYKPDSYHSLLTDLNLRPPVVTKYQYKSHHSKKKTSKGRKK